MVSNSARKAVREDGCMIIDVAVGGVTAIGYALYVGQDATDEEVYAVADSQLRLYGGRSGALQMRRVSRR